jgi:hypothetical protein
MGVHHRVRQFWHDSPVLQVPSPHLGAGARHAPSTQSVPVAQRMSQEPQLALSVRTFAQAPAQNNCDMPHGGRAHDPPWQVVPSAHRRPHTPQFTGSLVGSMHSAPHRIRGEKQPTCAA